MTSPAPSLTGARTLLRAPREADAADRLGLPDPAIQRMYGVSASDVRERSQADVDAWLQFLTQHPAAWVIDVGGRCVGAARLDDINRHDGSARYAVGVDVPELLGQGLGQEVTGLVLRYAFADLGLHRVGLRVLAINERAIRCYERCGFQVEGRERESAYIDGAYYDDLIMGVLAGEHQR